MLRPGIAYSAVKILAERYDVPVYTFYAWARGEGFPEGEGGARKKVYPDLEVDAWLKKNRPLVWAKANETEPFSSGGNPEDLLNTQDFAKIRADRYGGKPASDASMRFYEYNGWIPKPDRTPGDGLSPEVPVKMWRRTTIDAHVGSMKGPGNHSPEARGATARAKQDAADDDAVE